MLRGCFIYASLNNRCRSLVGVLEELGVFFSAFVFSAPLGGGEGGYSVEEAGE